MTVAELCDVCLGEGAGWFEASTLKADGGRDQFITLSLSLAKNAWRHSLAPTSSE